MSDLGLALIAGIDIPIPECKIIIHQPTLKEIGLIGEQKYFEGAQFLCISKKNLNIEDETVLENTSNFEIFMTAMLDTRMSEKKQNFIEAMSILFPNYKIAFTPSSLLLKKEKEVCIIDKDNFEILQNIVKEILCLSNSKSQQSGFNPQGKKAQEIAQKLMKARQKVAEEKGLENSSILGQQASMLAIGLSLSLKEVISMTLYQLFDQVERYQLYIAWSIDIRSRLAGAKAEKELEDWTKPIH